MSLAFISLIVLIGLLVAGVYLHKNNMENTYKKVLEHSPPISENAQNSEVDKMKDLRETMFTSQGSNFNALAIAAWMLLFVAAFYSFFLTPQFSEGLTFLKVPALASSPIGLLLFAVFALFIGSIIVIALDLPRFYGYYVLSKREKKAIMATWLTLWIPIFIPAYLATLFPYHDNVSILIDIAFVFLVGSQFILLSPIYFEAKGAKP